MSKLIYCATPSRLSHKTDEIMEFVRQQNNAPLHPFKALPFNYFEGSPTIGREKTIEWCLRLLEIADEFALCGVSHGTLQELIHAQKKAKPIKLYLKEFDPDWNTQYNFLGDTYGRPLDALLKQREV
ncbi:MAG TPA: hypothetical protein VJK51_01055 [Candidatus Nanoarchaeia archaeon]|nr:hypothetical protein [Candidatus Nanoarchaeia archaeon]